MQSVRRRRRRRRPVAKRQPRRGRGGRASTRLAETRARTGTPRPALVHPAPRWPAGPAAGGRWGQGGRPGAAAPDSAGVAARRNLNGAAASVSRAKGRLGMLKPRSAGHRYSGAGPPLLGDRELREARASEIGCHMVQEAFG
ncbi:translation initiation factor IF-2-like [Panthera leo]|uniref:translation initiation factor IF-2-like n=1 Tax=Panthera leo TaxID=9689 RepID=UPI001C6A3C2B|nr:translation initiation factor IF-2-like [Panthera leo]